MYFVKNEVTNLHETIEKFTKGNENLDFILPNQTALYDKIRLEYQFNKYFINICHDKNKLNHPIYKWYHCHKRDHLEPLCFSKMHHVDGLKRITQHILNSLKKNDPKEFGYQKQIFILFCRYALYLQGLKI